MSRTKPFPHQITGVNQICDFEGRALVADEMGLGKSFESLLYSEIEDLQPIVIVCPASIKWNWQHECATHIGIRAEVLEGTKPPKGKLLTSPQIVIINPDILKAWFRFLRNLKPRLIIWDECHYFSNPRAQRSKLMKRLC
jgi:SNF2 family DNA or RNA helicase